MTAGFTAAAIVGFGCYLRQSQTVPVNSDGAANALQAWAMLHGNLLLHGWSLSDVSFYTTELPQYMGVEAVRGLGPGVVHIAAAMTYTLLVLVAAVLAKGRSAGRVAVARAVIAAGIMAAPELGHATYILLLSPDHVGTLVPLLLIWLVIDRGPERWYVPAAVGALLAWVLLADPLVLIIGVLPLVIACAARAGRKLLVLRHTAGLRARLSACRYEIDLAAAAIVAVPAASLAGALISANGGFQVSPANTVFSTGRLLPDARLAGQGVLAFFGAYFGRQSTGPELFFAAVHLLGLALAAVALVLALARFLWWDDLLVPAFAIAIVVNIAAYIASTTPQNIRSSREFAAVLPFGAVLAGRVLTDGALADRFAHTFRRLGRSHRRGRGPARPVLLAVAAAGLLGYAAALGYGAAQPPARAASSDLASWLARHNLSSGLAGYWQADSVQLDSHGAIVLRPVVAVAGKVVPAWSWEADKSWFDSRVHHANFIVTARSGPFEETSLTPRAAIHTFGHPGRIYHLGRYTVLVFSANLLSRFRAAG